MIFSATLPSLLVNFTRAGLNDPKLIRLDAENQISDKLELQFFRVRGREKEAALVYLLSECMFSTALYPTPHPRSSSR